MGCLAKYYGMPHSIATPLFMVVDMKPYSTPPLTLRASVSLNDVGSMPPDIPRYTLSVVLVRGEW